MLDPSFLQFFGYAASVLIVVSMLMRSIVKLRAINLAGAAMFSAYGFLIGAYPVGILNLVTSVINIVQLSRLRRRREIFRLIEIRPDSPYVAYLLEFQADDIRRFFPAFRAPDPNEPSRIALIVLRDLVPAGVLLGRLEDRTLHVDLDYVVPQYRDMKVGTYLFSDEASFFRARGIERICARADSPEHAAYLERMGFRRDEASLWTLHL
jgi:hypothetical protein